MVGPGFEAAVDAAESLKKISCEIRKPGGPNFVRSEVNEGVICKKSGVVLIGPENVRPTLLVATLLVHVFNNMLFNYPVIAFTKKLPNEQCLPQWPFVGQPSR